MNMKGSSKKPSTAELGKTILPFRKIGISIKIHTASAMSGMKYASY